MKTGAFALNGAQPSPGSAAAEPRMGCGGAGAELETRVEATAPGRGASWARRAGGKWQILGVWGRELFQSPVAAVTNSHKLSGFNQHKLIISQF